MARLAAPVSAAGPEKPSIMGSRGPDPGGGAGGSAPCEQGHCLSHLFPAKHYPATGLRTASLPAPRLACAIAIPLRSGVHLFGSGFAGLGRASRTVELPATHPKQRASTPAAIGVHRAAVRLDDTLGCLTDCDAVRSICFILSSLAPQCGQVDAQDAGRLLLRLSTGENAQDVLALDLFHRAVAAEP